MRHGLGRGAEHHGRPLSFVPWILAVGAVSASPLSRRSCEPGRPGQGPAMVAGGVAYDAIAPGSSRSMATALVAPRSLKEPVCEGFGLDPERAPPSEGCGRCRTGVGRQVVRIRAWAWRRSSGVVSFGGNVLAMLSPLCCRGKGCPRDRRGRWSAPALGDHAWPLDRRRDVLVNRPLWRRSRPRGAASR